MQKESEERKTKLFTIEESVKIKRSNKIAKKANLPETKESGVELNHDNDELADDDFFITEGRKQKELKIPDYKTDQGPQAFDIN